jgi:hypothetical protein
MAGRNGVLLDGSGLVLRLTRPINAAGEDLRRYTSHSGVDLSGAGLLRLDMTDERLP